MVEPPSSQNAAPMAEDFQEEMVWKQLKTVRDPEIPVNIVDLGLVYAVSAKDVSDGKRIEVRMTLTAPGCPMAGAIQTEVERKLAAIPGVRAVKVEIVFDPPWDKSKMSEAARLHLGFDLATEAASLPSGPFQVLR